MSKCNWCDQLEERRLRFEFYWIDDEGHAASFQAPHVIAAGVAKYCPACGRKLGEESTMTDKEKVQKLVEIIEEICYDQRDRHGDDSVCGLCEYDGPSWMECPGFETDECFKLSESFKRKYIQEEDHE